MSSRGNARPSPRELQAQLDTVLRGFTNFAQSAEPEEMLEIRRPVDAYSLTALVSPAAVAEHHGT